MRKTWRKIGNVFVVALVGLFAVSGCGSGGGSSSGDSGGAVPSGYSGVTQQAVLDQDNAEQIVLDAYEGGAFQSQMGTVSPLALEASSSYALVLAEALESSLRDAGLGEPAVSPQAVADEYEETFYSSCGTMTQTVTVYTDNTFSGSLVYDNYCPDGTTTLTGSMTYSGSYDMEAETISFTLTYEDLTTSMEGGESVTASGSMTMEVSFSETSGFGGGTYSMDTVLTDNVSGEAYWLNDYTMTVTPGTDFYQYEISGRFYNPVHGYVDISTPLPLQISTLDGLAEAGVLRFDGADGTYVVMTLTGGGGYVLENQDGVVVVEGVF